LGLNISFLSTGFLNNLKRFLGNLATIVVETVLTVKKIPIK